MGFAGHKLTLTEEASSELLKKLIAAYRGDNDEDTVIITSDMIESVQ